MEGVVADFTVGSGVLLAAVAVLVLVLGGLLLGRLSDEEKKGKRFYWAEWPLWGSEPEMPEEGVTRRAA